MTGHARRTPRAAPSIRSGLRRGLLARLGAVLAVVGTALYLFVRFTLTAEFDAALSARARVLAAAVKVEDAGGGRIEFDSAGESMAEFTRPRNPEYFQLWTLPDGGPPQTVQKSASLAGAALPGPPAPDADADPSDLPLPDGRAGRCVWLAFTSGLDVEDEPQPAPSPPLGPRPMLLALARSRSDLDRALYTTLVALLGAGGLVSAGAILAVHRAVRAGLAPIDALAASVAALDPDALPARLDLPPLPREVEPVHARLDALLSRLHSAFERERRFTAAAAHELRTPLAELHSLLDVRLKWPESERSCIASLSEARAVTVGMERLVGVLLALAHAQNRRTALHDQPVDIAAELRAALARHAPSAAAGGLHVTAELPPSLYCRADRTAVGLIVENLVANATGYTPAGGRIEVRAGPQNGFVRLDVANGPTDLSQGDVPRMFEPFWRRDAARQQGADHLGLGLTLCEALAREMGGTLHAALDGDRLRITCLLRAPSDATQRIDPSG